MHETDREWVTSQIKRLPAEFRSDTWERYEALYWDVYNNEPVNHKKENAARKAANNRLRVFLTEVQEAVGLLV